MRHSSISSWRQITVDCASLKSARDGSVQMQLGCAAAKYMVHFLFEQCQIQSGLSSTI
jgi:hypothetical protein